MRKLRLAALLASVALLSSPALAQRPDIDALCGPHKIIPLPMDPQAMSMQFKIDETRQQCIDRVLAEHEANVRRQYEDWRKEWDARRAGEQAKYAKTHDCKIKGGVLIGMTKEQVLASCWDKPYKVNKTQVPGHTQEQWVYSLDNLLYFDDGILTGIQTSR